MKTHAALLLPSLALASCSATNGGTPWPVIITGLALHAIALAVFVRAIRRQRLPRLRGKGPLPVIGRHNGLNDALHARLCAAAK